MSVKIAESHPLFKNAADLPKITSPTELGYHPDTVLSVFEHFAIQPKQMSNSGVRGDDFVAIRCAPTDKYTLAHAKVECVYLRFIEGKWCLRKLGKSLSDQEFNTFAQLTEGKEVEMDTQRWKRI